MHELSLAENLLQIIEDAAHEQQFTRVKTVFLEIGQLACVELESLRFYFEIVTQDSVARQAKLEIIEIAGQALCTQCRQCFPIVSHDQACSHCGSYARAITQGGGMRILELEVE
ncbi:hydrogenase maturation nickel metallochaperone HypA [Nitrosomonas sp. sh817]|uniref:hydrogenase maturation nickel metallochaperone HypA n=1 Tax=Nitrosomonas sp. sh817 TaxID=3070658 RepID=UPI0027DC25E0|nr:hydrogenase maturation nickel metallochaperone HypA [Nitrosomonas sp. sh817]WMJ07371.1 hydrogenase maturation nickel metallochaperone HypA [Nitrosomonas sp. sh817]